MAHVIMRIVGAADGSPHPFQGKYVRDYDPEAGDNPYAGRIEVTSDPKDAKVYTTVSGFREWNRVSMRQRYRPDGLINRPLTAFSVEFITVGDD